MKESLNPRCLAPKFEPLPPYHIMTQNSPIFREGEDYSMYLTVKT